MIRELISKLFRPAIIFPIPAGQVADKTGANGLIGLMSNANAYALQMSSTATAGTNVNITAAAVASGVISLNAGASGGFTATLPATSAIIAALGPGIPLDGTFSKQLYIVNNLVGQPGTLTAGDANTTIVGAAVLGSTYTRTYMLNVLGSANISLTNIGQLPL